MVRVVIQVVLAHGRGHGNAEWVAEHDRVGLLGLHPVGPLGKLAVELPPGLRRTKLPAPWLEYQDPGTGHSYFVNPQTGASQWARPS